MADIVLSTVNAKYIHPAFGLRYLLANLGALQARAEIVEFDARQRPVDVAESLLARSPGIIGFGVYIWNVTALTEVVALMKRLRPDLPVVLGGPEVSHEQDGQPIVALADHVIEGEADLAFPELCEALLRGERPPEKILRPPVPDLTRVQTPYAFYTEEDLAHRVLYVEASRGCPFGCEFCLSALDIPVRQFPLPRVFTDLEMLMARGARHFKFVDRTFNLNLQASRAILEFCLAHCREDRFFHFEMVPDRFPEILREVVVRFPPGALQFEVGVQSFDEKVCALIHRRQDVRRVEENLRFLRENSGVHLHADLIAGLPGESLEGFAAGFDRMIALRPHEIQVGILKRLRGTTIGRHDDAWQMVYHPEPPYELLQNGLIGFADMQRLRRFARYWDLVGNSGNFVESAPLIWIRDPSPFAGFLRWSDWLFQAIGRTDAIALSRLTEHLFRFLTTELGLDSRQVAEVVWRDSQRCGRSELPDFLRPWVSNAPAAGRERKARLPRRQARHLNR